MAGAVKAQNNSASSGAWSSPNTWQGAIIPASDGSVVISHQITIDRDVLIGSSGLSEIAAIIVSSGGSLTVAPGRTLTVRGNIILDNAELKLEAGSRLMFDASNSLSPSATRYRLQIGTADNQSARLRAPCLKGARCTITSYNGNGAGQAYITNAGYSGGGLVQGEYVDFERIGDEQTPAINFSLNKSSSFVLRNASFNSGGMISSAGALGPNARLDLENIIWRNTLAPFSLVLNANEPLEEGVRNIRGCAFDAPVRFYPPVDLSIEDNYFNNAFDVTSGRWRSFRNNFVRSTSQPAIRIAGDTTANYWLLDNPAVKNPHFIQALSYAGNLKIEQNIFELNGDDADGDCVLLGSPNLPSIATLRRNLVLPNTNGNSSCTLFSALGNENVSLIVENNTYIMGNQGAAVGETYPGHTDMVLSFRSNLAWDDFPRGYKLYDSPPNNNIPDLIRSYNADYNGGFNFLSGSNGRGYHNLEFSSGDPGLNDIEADPEFVDKKRSFASWAVQMGYALSVNDGLEILRAANDGGERGQQIAGLRRYVEEGFRPLNQAYLGSSHQGKNVGAVQPFRDRPRIRLRPLWIKIKRGQPVIRATCLMAQREQAPQYEFLVNRSGRLKIRLSQKNRIRIRARNFEQLERLSIRCRYIIGQPGEKSELSRKKNLTRRQSNRLRLRA